MPESTPHGIQHPLPDDEFDPAVDMATMATGIEAVFVGLDQLGLPGTTWTVAEPSLTWLDGTSAGITLTPDSTARHRRHGPIQQFTFAVGLTAALPTTQPSLIVVTPVVPVDGFAIAAATRRTGTTSTALTALPHARGFQVTNPGFAAGDRLLVTAEFEAANA